MSKSIPTRTIAILVLALGFTSCVSVVKVEKFTGAQKGFRYSLPRPYILVTPRADGGLDVQPIMLPDADNEYVVRTFSILSSYKYDMAFEQGLLKSATGKQDSGALAAQLLTNTGAVVKSRIDANVEAEKDLAKRRLDADKAVRDARLERDQAKAELDKLNALKDAGQTIDPKTIIDAEIKLARAEAKLTNAENVLNSSSFNLPGMADPTAIGTGQAWGPVLYAVVQTKDGNVFLKAVQPQLAFDTIALPAKKDDGGASSGDKPTELKLSLTEPGPFSPSSGGRVTFRITSTKQLKDVNTERTVLRSKISAITILPENNNYSLSLKDEGREIEVSIGPAVPSGGYNITPAVKLTDQGDFTTPKTLTFDIQR